jgi:hypothetical protein
MSDFSLLKLFSLPDDIILNVFTFDNRFFYKNGKYCFISKIPKTDERYNILLRKIMILKSSNRGLGHFPKKKYDISLYDDGQDVNKFSLEIQKSIKIFKNLYW